ncbi:MAG TPA: chemotaxis protein CheA [Thermodesulfobacteriota bacterium]
MDLAKYRAMFVTEAQEHLRQMSAGVLGLEQDPGDAERIQSLFRNAHSIKGMAASMGYEGVAALSHRLEDLMDRYRSGRLAVEPTAVDLLLEGIDALAHHVQAIADQKDPEVALEPLVAKVQAFLEGAGGSAPAPAAAPAGAPAPPPARPASAAPTGPALLSVTVQIEKHAQAARVRAFMVHRRLAEIGTIVASVPSAADLRAGQGDFDGVLKAALETAESPEAVRRAIAALADVASVVVEATGGELSPQGARVPPPRPAAPAPGPKLGVPRTVKVQTDLLDSFVNLAGELLVVESRLKEATRDLELPSVKDSTSTLGKLIRGLHAQLMTVRMMPLASVTEALPRVVRDLAKREGKEVAFVQEGTDLELDRSLLEELPDLLTHVLRNAVDHGLERADEREAAGKPRRGQIRLRAFRQKDKAVVQIEDDGRGMDPARLRAKAVERGQITPEQAAAMSDAEALHLSCLPGLSTAGQVTDVSGRGVGMDAVKSRVEGLGGSLHIDSRVGRGTRISLHLPTSVAIVQVLLLGIDDEVFAIPVTRVLRTLELTPGEVEQRGRQLLFRYGEESVPLLSLRKILRLPAPETRGRFLSVAVVPVRQRTVGLVVDRFVGQQEAFIKPLPRPLASIDGVAGVTILGDGRAVFLLDSENLF